MAAMNSPSTLPGRLGNPDMDISTDARSNPKVVQQLAAFGMDNNQTAPDVELNIKALTPGQAAADAQYNGLYNMMENDLPGDATEPKVDESEISIKGEDGNDIKLHIFRPAGVKGTLPCVIYSHGGGMVIIDTYNKAHVRWCVSIAASGVVCIMTDFRNAYSKSGHNPFPKGLNDCAAAAKYVAEHRGEFNIGKIVLQGESGGGNLAITTALKAKRDGWLDEIAGIYACVPYISGAYGWSKERRLKELPSLVECDGYLLNTTWMGQSAFYYSPNDLTNPHAWPYYASVEDLQGLPPTILSMDEMDPLKDEGLIFYQKLAAAGVEVVGRLNMGVTHGSSLVFRKALPEVHNAAIRDIASFAKSL